YLSASALVAAGMFMAYGGAWLSYLGYTLAGFAAPILYLIWMVRSDRYEREPLPLVAMTFGWGVFLAFFAALFNLFVVPFLGALGVALVEEPLKLMGVYWLARHRRLGSELNDHLDGMVYGAAAGAGFAGIENLYYLLEMIAGGGVSAVGAIAVRSATAFCHIAWSAFAGRSLGVAKAMRGYNRLGDLIPGLVVAVPMHFLWNASSLEVALFVLLPIYVVILIRMVKAARKDEETWDYPASAPVE
ncbi:MAG: PrsW family intramembrane metalloprotease, partial [Candidatus Bathyarchaeia archaeon]